MLHYTRAELTQPDAHTLELEFEFRLANGPVFRPRHTYKFPSGLPVVEEPARLQAWAFRVGLVELISYWKAACPPEVRVEAGYLTPDEVRWWRHLWFQGLGEFFYLNGLYGQVTAEDYLRVVCPLSATGATAHRRSAPVADSRALLVPIGGGKDSAVTLSLLLANPAHRVVPFCINPRGAMVGTLAVDGLTPNDGMVVRRTLAPELLELNAAGYLNGHTPFSALVAFSAGLAAVAAGIPAIALSNEGSASEPTVANTDVNHQYSKSLAFEQDFRAYTAGYLPPAPNYFSLLRPLNELQITALFVQANRYLSVFRSCNVGSKTDTWCGRCPKCLFTAIMLAAFLPVDHVHELLGRPILDDLGLAVELDRLTGLVPEKPFECVGTRDEVRQAIAAFARRIDQPLPALLADWYARYGEAEPAPVMELSTPAHPLDHCVPPDLYAELTQALDRLAQA
jgi:hypothetical protein